MHGQHKYDQTRLTNAHQVNSIVSKLRKSQSHVDMCWQRAIQLSADMCHWKLRHFGQSNVVMCFGKKVYGFKPPKP